MNSRLVEQQRKSFDRLVESGVYDSAFEHAPAAKRFVAEVIEHLASKLARNGRFFVLDCGCGTGVWLEFLREELSRQGIVDLRLCGFDLSERMINVAHEKLRDIADPANIRCGNALDPQSYAFTGADSAFDLVFAYDIVQQLPRARQKEACDLMVNAVKCGGVAVIFDNDSETRFGRRMALRKFLTRYCGFRLVPRYYCNAVYPPLERFRWALDQDPNLCTEIVVRSDGVKRALIVLRRGHRTGMVGSAVENPAS